MSHISQVKVQFKNLVALQKACDKLGIRFIENKKTFAWYRGKTSPCEHAISVPNTTYEIGLVKNADGVSYSMQYDDYKERDNVALNEVIGRDACLLKQAYTNEVVRAQLRSEGITRISETKVDGKVRLVARR